MASGLCPRTVLTLYREEGGGPFQRVFCLFRISFHLHLGPGKAAVIPTIWEKSRARHLPHAPPTPCFLCGGDTVAKGREGAAID